jgi:predicted ATPase
MAESRSRTLRFTSLQVFNWRNFANVNIEFQKRIFLIGPNASGKSNFLDIFRFLHDIVSVGGGFQEAVRRRTSVSSIRCLSARSGNIKLYVSVGTDEHPRIWEYQLEFAQDYQRQPIVKKEIVKNNGNEILSRPEPNENNPLLLTQTHLEQVLASQKFRELSDFFQNINYLHIVPQIVRDADRSIGKINDPYGGDFLDNLSRTPERILVPRLEKIQNALKLALPQLTEMALFKDERGKPHLRAKYENWRAKGTWQTEKEFSDGTIRLIGLLWTILDGRGPILLEEPELSLHPEVVRQLPQIFSRIQIKTSRQIFTTTHSPSLLFDKGIALDEVLLLEPGEDGTYVNLANNFRDIKLLVEGGIPLPDVVVPRSSPKTNIAQLSLFSDAR